jgi:O-antigen ligase
MSATSFYKYGIPLFLICPMLNLGGFGFTLVEIAFYFFGWMLIFINKPKLPLILYLFFVILILGRIGALYNSIQYNLPFDYTKAIFLFILSIQLSAFYVGRLSNISFEQLILSRLSTIVIGLVLFVATIYLFISPDYRLLMLRFFSPPGDTAKYNNPRFPGLGINSNVYAFLIYTFFLFSLKNFFENRSGFFFSFCCIIIIILCASKTILALTLTSLFIFAVYHLFVKPTDKSLARSAKKPIYVLAILGTLVGLGFILYQNETVGDYITILRRLDDILNNTSSSDGRKELWQLGMERVQMAPILGIDVVQSNLASDTIPLYFVTPHNEFIFYWMSLGILGFIAYPILLIYFIYLNLFRRFELVWVLLLFALIIQMFVDGAFQYLRFQFFFFAILGNNYRFIKTGINAK